MAGQTVGFSIRFACTDVPRARTGRPAAGMSSLPGVRGHVALRVHHADLAHVASACRPASSAARASGAVRPAFISASPSGPYDGIDERLRGDRAHAGLGPGHRAEPTENQWLCTATPISPVAGSRATIE